MKRIILRRMTEGDLPAADELRRLARWNQTAEEWRRLLSLEPEGCFVALQQGNVIGTVTTTIYGQALAWIGMMLVHPDHRGRGIGTGLMRQALEYLRDRGVKCVKLDATPAGHPLYEKLGFVSESALTRCQRPANGQSVSADSAAIGTRSPGEADWPALEEIDGAAFGVCRLRLLRSLATESRAVVVWPAKDQVIGWGMLRPGTNADYLGPLACADLHGSWPLMTALLRVAGDRSVIWDVPDANEMARTAARQLGFAPLRPLTRMRLGPGLVARDPGACLAIADPSVG